MRNQTQLLLIIVYSGIAFASYTFIVPREVFTGISFADALQKLGNTCKHIRINSIFYLFIIFFLSATKQKTEYYKMLIIHH